MLGFTLSKFSLLILVVSIFGIVSFFTLHLTESLKVKALTDLLADDSSIASEMMSSPSYCDRLLIKIPETVRLSTSELYYVMKISSQTATVDGVAKTFLIFSAANKSKPEQTIAASSSPTLATVKFYSNKDYNPVSEIVLDPSARSTDPNSADAFYLVKEVKVDEANDKAEVMLYVFPCSISGGEQSTCQAALAAVGKKVHAGEPVQKFKCGD